VVERCPGDPRRHLRERVGHGAASPVLRQRRTRRLAAGLADARLLAPDDERIRSTIFAIADDLTDGPFVFRYRPEKTTTASTVRARAVSPSVPSGLCRRWSRLANSTARARTARNSSGPPAARSLRRRTGSDHRTHLGNFPQALTHLALINAILSVIGVERVKARPPRAMPTHTVGGTPTRSTAPTRLPRKRSGPKAPARSR